MKELSIEERAKRYDEAVEKAKEYFNSPRTCFDIEQLCNVFPELKESEDDVIRKAIIGYLKHLRGKHELFPDDWIAWLEKQGEQKSATDFSDLRTWKYIVDAVLTEENGIGNYLDRPDTEEIAKKLQEIFGNVEQKPVFEMKTPEESLGVDSDTYNKIIDECIYGEQMPADKVEPKFKVGDWIVFNGLTLYIKEVVKGYYRTISKGGITNSYGWDIDNVARLWTIQDAKDGDVLNSPTHRLIWIYKDNEHYHACVNMNYVTENVVTDGLISISNDACPATKDEQAILFAMMKEAGYEWNAEKKELKKIEQKPAWSEEDETALGDALWCCKQAASIAKDENDMGNVWYAENWLKSLHPQKYSQINGAEMQKNLDTIFEAIDKAKNELRKGNNGAALDALCIQYPGIPIQEQWKPSESDILLLERIANGKSDPQDFQASLYALIGQLKKLKG